MAPKAPRTAFFRASRAGGREGLDVARFGTPVPAAGEGAGLFGEWRWDPATSQLDARVDRHGLFSLFYSGSGETIALSPSPIQLIATGVSPEPDYRALALFYMIGWFIEEDTPFRDIKVLPANGRLRWRPGQLSVTGGLEVVPERSITVDAAIDGYIDLFRVAVKRCAEAGTPKLVVPLSGGRDSRHLMLEAVALGHRPDHCVSLDAAHAGVDPDAACAVEIARAVGVRHHSLEALRSPFRDQGRVLMLTHLCSDEHAQFVTLARYLEQQRCSVLDGLGGGVLSRNRGLTNRPMHRLMRAGKWEEATDVMVSGLDRLTGTTVAERIGPQPEVARRVDEARAYFASMMKRYADAADPSTMIHFAARTRREIALVPAALFHDVEAVFCPYLDPSLVDFCLSLPFEVTANDFHDAVIAREFPEYRAVPYHNDVEGRWGRPSVLLKLRMLAEGVASARARGTAAMLPEAVDQARMLVDRKHRQLVVSRTHRRTMQAITDATAAGRLLRSMHVSAS